MFQQLYTIHIIHNILIEEDIDLVIEEIVNNKDFEKSDTEIETYESIEEVKFTPRKWRWMYYYTRWSQWKRNERS